jgi:hypothetical protein
MKLIFQKELKTLLIIAIEAYRVCSGTLLVIFVPGVCGNHACLPHENYMNGTTLYRGIVFVNLATLFVFLALYGIEIRREFRLHTYLRINKALPTDSESVGKSIELLRTDKKVKLNTLTHIYKIVGIVTVVTFIINTFLSGYIIMTEYGNDKGPVIFATNTLFISGKLYDIYTIVTSEKNVYFSAYEKNHLQYNVANPEKCETERIVLANNTV